MPCLSANGMHSGSRQRGPAALHVLSPEITSRHDLIFPDVSNKPSDLKGHGSSCERTSKAAMAVRLVYEYVLRRPMQGSRRLQLGKSMYVAGTWQASP